MARRTWQPQVLTCCARLQPTALAETVSAEPDDMKSEAARVGFQKQQVGATPGHRLTVETSGQSPPYSPDLAFSGTQ